MCVTCNKDCNGDCSKRSELYNSSQIQYDGPKITLPNSGIVIEPCDNLNDIISLLANKIEELSTP